MILKLLDSADLPDDDNRKGCCIISDIRVAEFHYLATGEAALEVQYSTPNRGLISEVFVLKGNAYLMNDAGKTIQSFACLPQRREDKSPGDQTNLIKVGEGVFSRDGRIVNLTPFAPLDERDTTRGMYVAPVYQMSSRSVQAANAG